MTLTIDTLAQKDVVALDDDCDARDAARAMRERRVGSVVVTHGAGRSMRLAGIVTDRDIAMALGADEQPPTVALKLLARRPLVTVSHTASVVEASRIMLAAGVRRLVLVDEHRHMVGIVSLDDMLGATNDLLGALVQASRRRSEHDAGADPASTTSHGPLLVSPDLAASWRHMVR